MSRLKSSLTSIPIEVPPIIQQNMDPGMTQGSRNGNMDQIFNILVFSILGDPHKVFVKDLEGFDKLWGPNMNDVIIKLCCKMRIIQT